MAKSVGWALVVGGALMCATSTFAYADELSDPVSVSFDDPIAALAQVRSEPMIEAGLREGAGPRFASPAPDEVAADAQRRFEVELAANGSRTGMGFDVAIAQRASFGANAEGDLEREGRAAEVRFGQGLGERRGLAQRPTWYLFAASEDEAVTWRPGVRTAFGGAGNSFALQDRVEVGDLQAGVTYERGAMQTSLAYVEREVSTQIGVQSWSQDESFAGLTLTVKR